MNEKKLSAIESVTLLVSLRLPAARFRNSSGQFRYVEAVQPPICI